MHIINIITFHEVVLKDVVLSTIIKIYDSYTAVTQHGDSSASTWRLNISQIVVGSLGKYDTIRHNGDAVPSVL